MIRRQLPVYSPLSIPALLRTACRTPFDSGEAKAALAGMICAEFQGVGAVLTDTGTSALHLALLGASRWNAGAPVALPAFGCYDLATAALAAGVRVLLYDVDPLTLAPELGSVEEALAAGAGTVVCASLYGLPTTTRSCAELATAHGATLIVDAAQAWGAREEGRPYASHGSLAVASFGRGKGYTGGGGGALVACDARGMQMLSGLPHPRGERPGWTELLKLGAQWLVARPAIYGIPSSLPGLRLGETIFHPPSPAGTMGRAPALLLNCTRGAALSELERRRSNAAFLRSHLAGHPTLRTPRLDPCDEPSYLRLPVLQVSSAGDRGLTLDDRRLGIARSYPRPLSQLPGFADSSAVLNASACFEGAHLLASRLVTLPTHSRLGRRDLERLKEWISGRADGRGEGESSGAEEHFEAEVGG